jgi:hypothetical protein
VCAPGKSKVVKRYHSELERTRRAHQSHLRLVHSVGIPINCACEFQAGRFRKRKPLGCGRSRCRLCHFEKIFGVRSLNDRRCASLTPWKIFGERNDAAVIQSHCETEGETVSPATLRLIGILFLVTGGRRYSHLKHVANLGLDVSTAGRRYRLRG